MAEPSPPDDPDLVEDRDSNLQEESTETSPELCDDGASQEPQVKDSASCSAINEANKKPYASSSRNRDSSETDEIRRVDKEEDRYNGDDEHEDKESDDDYHLDERYQEMVRYYDRIFGLSDYKEEEAVYRETQRDEDTCSQNPRLNQIATSGQTSDHISQLSSGAAPWSPHNTRQNPNRSEPEMTQVMMPSHQNPRLNQIARSGRTTNLQRQHRGPNRGSTSDRNNMSQAIGMQSQFSPNTEPPQNTYQQYGLPESLDHDDEPLENQNTSQQYELPESLDHNSEPLGIQNTYQQYGLAESFDYSYEPLGSQNTSQQPTSDRYNISQHIGMQSQISPNAEAPQNTSQQYELPESSGHNYEPWGIQNTSQQYGLPESFGHNYEPWGIQNTYQQHPVANQMPMPPPQIYSPMRPMWPMQEQMMYPYQDPLAYQQNLSYQHPMAYQQNLSYQHPMAYPRGQPRSFARGQNYFNPQAPPALNRRQMLQFGPQPLQPRQSQGFNTRPSSKQGRNQQQPR